MKNFYGISSAKKWGVSGGFGPPNVLNEILGVILCVLCKHMIRCVYYGCFFVEGPFLLFRERQAPHGTCREPNLVQDDLFKDYLNCYYNSPI